MLVFVAATAPLLVVGPRKVGEHIPERLANALHYAYYPAVVLGIVIGIVVLYRVALPEPLPTHRLIFGATLAATVFVIATLILRIYLRWITSTGYTYGALSTPIAFLLFAYFGGFAVMLGAELNATIQEEFPAPKTHAHRLRKWLVARLSSDKSTMDSPTPKPDVATAEPPA
jgi:membrane protein